MEEVTVDQTQVVVFYPERQKRQPKSSLFAYDLINYKQTSIYTYLDPGVNIKEVLKAHFNKIFNRSAIQIEESRVKPKKNKANKVFTRYKGDLVLIDPGDMQNEFIETYPAPGKIQQQIINGKVILIDDDFIMPF